MHEYLLPILDVVRGHEAGDDAVARVLVGHKLRVGEERVVGLVGEGGAVGIHAPEVQGDVDGAVLAGGVEDLVRVVRPVRVVVVLPRPEGGSVK